MSVGKAALEVRLERYGTAPHVPRSVFELRGQKEFDSPLVGRIGRREGAGLFQGHQRLPRCIGITGERGKLSPTAVGSLLGQQVARGSSSEDFPVLSRPSQAEELKGPVLGRRGRGLLQPLLGALDRRLVLAPPCSWGIDLKRPQ